MFASPSSPYPASYLAGNHMSNIAYYPPQLYGGYGVSPYGQAGLGLGAYGQSTGIPNPGFMGTALPGTHAQMGAGLLGFGGSVPAQGLANNLGISGAVVSAPIPLQQVQGAVQKSFSRVEYIPYESYYIDYQQQQFVQNVIVPVQRKVRDYYAVEHVVDYMPKQIDEVVVEYVPKETVSERLYYVPVQTQIVHMPQQTQTLQTQQIHGVKTVQGAVTRPTQQTVITTQQQTQGMATIPAPQTIITQQQPLTTITQTQTQVQRPQQIITQQIGQGQVRPGSQVRSVSPVQVRVQTPQRTQFQPAPIQNVPIQRKTSVPQNVTAPVPMPAPGLGAASLGGTQFKQPPQVIQTNQAQLLKKASIPQNANVQYQYSTRSVRNLSSEQIAARGLNKPGVVSGSRVGQLGGTIVSQGAQSVVGQQQQFSSTLPPRVQGSIVNQQQTTSSLPGGRITTSVASFGRQTQPQPAVSLMRNDQVDLTDSQHIDITKSKFNAQYASGPQSSLGGAGFGAGNVNTSTNPNLFGNNNNQNNLANRTSGKESNPQVHRISAESVYDYKKLGDY